MNKILVTGATGLVGYSIVQELLRKKKKVSLLVRDTAKAEKIFGGSCKLIRGDVTDAQSVIGAAKGMDTVFHAAGLPEQWLKNPATFTKVNVNGTRNVLEACRFHKVKTLVYTSTIDVFRAGPGEAYDESEIDSEPKGTHYERSKQEADEVVVTYLREKMKIIFIHPAAVYGPGPAGSPGINDLIVKFHKKQVPMLLPGGMPVVFSEDLGRISVAAAEKGKHADRFIVSEDYYTLQQLGVEMVKNLGLKKVPVVLPLGLARFAARLLEVVAKITGLVPLIPVGQLHFLQWGARPQSKKAQKFFRWKPTPMPAGIAATVNYLKKNGQLS